jgi:hydrogenase expression/formation protein HypC
MCVAVPAEVIEITENMATVDFGEGTTRKINISLVDAYVGTYVLVHAGFAIQVIDEKAAEETLRFMETLI